MTYTSRERMRISMSGGQPDRVPVMPQICYGHAIHTLYDDFRKELIHAAGNPRRLCDLPVEVCTHYDVDGMRLFPLPEPVRVFEEGGQLVAIDPKTDKRIGRIDELGGGQVVPDEFPVPITSVEDVQRIPRITRQELLSSDAFGYLAEATARAQKADMAVFGSMPPFTVNAVGLYRGRQQALIDLVEAPELVDRIMEIETANAVEWGHAWIEIGVDGLQIGDPSSSSSLISPQHFKRFSFVRFKQFCDALRDCGVPIYLHICGNSNPIMEIVAETGVNGFDPLDPLGGMDIADVKRRVGDRLTLMGALNPLTLLNGTPEQVYQEGTACCEAGAAGGGYVLTAGDMVPDKSPAENLFAMVRAAKDFHYDDKSGHPQPDAISADA